MRAYRARKIASEGDSFLEKERRWKRNWADRNKKYMRDYQYKWWRKRLPQEKKENCERVKEYYRQNTKAVNRRGSKRRMEKYKSNPQFRLSENLRARTILALKGEIKSGKTIELLGCSWLELRAHIEKQFGTGMTWENYGAWHVDHIRPCASFDLSKESEQRMCFHFTNLQPLWAQDNLSKGKKMSTNYCIGLI